MLSIQNNILAMNADRQLGINRKKKEKLTEKLASGYKINRAADDAAGLSISEKMRRQIRGLQKGKENITDGISWVQTGDGAMEEIAQMIHRMEELAVKGANGTLQAADRAAIDEEIKQLKREINDIAKWTTFNDKKIFDNDQIDIDIEGTLDDLQIYDATYDEQTGDVTYGGFLFRGQRISWNTIEPDMVSYDPDTKQQIFKGGSYDFWDKDGFHFHVNCEPGATVPEITRTVKVEAYDGGITIDGAMIPWGELYDEEGKTAAQTCHDGTWYADYKDLTIAFYFPDGTIGSRDDMRTAISFLNTHDSKVKYHLEQTYAGPSEEQAVDVVEVGDLRISNHLANKLICDHDEIHKQFVEWGTPDPITGKPVAVTKDDHHTTPYIGENNNDYSVVVKADDTGVWLQYEFSYKYWDENQEQDVTESYIEIAEDSKRTWEEMGLKDWFDGYDVKGGKYEYTYVGDNEDNVVNGNETFLSFNFTLSDITSKDSVIDGLDGMRISGGNIRTKYGTAIDIALDDNILAAFSSSRTNVTFAEEKAFGRDFDDPEASLSEDSLVYDVNTGNISLKFTSADLSTELTYEGINDQTEKMNKDLEKYADYMLKDKISLALAGKDPQASRPPRKSLSDLVGKSNITSSGYFDQVITITPDMKLGNGGGSGYPVGEVGKTYPAAMIDFKGMGTGTINLDSLADSGFNSTCKTCDRHYSIVFANGGSDKSTPQGYGYKFEADGDNYKLTLDLDTLKAAGVDTAAELTDAIVDVTSECFDFHYTQYASKDGALYIYDDREDSEPAQSATFGDWPFSSIEMDRFDFRLEDNNGEYVATSYLYSFADFEDSIIVKMQQNNTGEYVELTDGSGNSYYEKYDPANHGAVLDSQRFDLSVTYQDKLGNQVVDLGEARDSYASYAFDKMLNQSKVQLNAQDYTKMAVGGYENRNVAIRPTFDTEFVKEIVDNGINIRCSAQDGDRTTIPRFGVSTFSLKLYRAGAKTQEQADKTMEITKRALEHLNERRTTYGAMQNRLEHAYNMRDNTQENTTAAESRLRDTDVAKEMLDFSNQNILMQAGSSMLTQANSASQYVLSLLQ